MASCFHLRSFLSAFGRVSLPRRFDNFYVNSMRQTYETGCLTTFLDFWFTCIQNYFKGIFVGIFYVCVPSWYWLIPGKWYRLFLSLVTPLGAVMMLCFRNTFFYHHCFYTWVNRMTRCPCLFMDVIRSVAYMDNRRDALLYTKLDPIAGHKERWWRRDALSFFVRLSRAIILIFFRHMRYFTDGSAARVALTPRYRQCFGCVNYWKPIKLKFYIRTSGLMNFAAL